MTLDVTVKVFDDNRYGFAGDNLAEPNKPFLGLDFGVELYGLRLFIKYARALKDVMRLSIGCPPANPPASQRFYITKTCHFFVRKLDIFLTETHPSIDSLRPG